jgi:chromosomal replication initiator protein
LLCGPAGVGKTHLLRAIQQHVASDSRRGRTVHFTADEVVEQLLAAARTRESGLPSIGWDSADLIILDDLHTLAGRQMTQKEVARLVGLALVAGSRVVCAIGAPVARLGPFLAALRKTPGSALAILGRAGDGELRRILADITAQGDRRLRRRVVAALTDSAGGDVRRAVGALTSYRFRASLPPAI